MTAPLQWEQVRREPPEETLGLYPGLVVCDNRKSGSITAGQTRIPLWAIYHQFVEWDDYCDGTEGITAEQAARFVNDLLEMRGEFGRLLLVLADAARRERTSSPSAPAWWDRPRTRQRVKAQLQRCLAALEALG